MLPILLLAATAYGAAIPPSSQSCLEKCLVTGGIVGAAADLSYFKSVAVDINNFCNVYTTLLKCASECSQDDLNLVIKHTLHASFICKEKMEEIKTVHDCLESDTNDPLTDCSKVCEVTEHVPLRLDSTATAPVNPNVPAEGTGPLCEKQLCVLKCAREQLNKQCAGSGDLFKEVARHQVEVGWQMLTAQSENMNDTANQMVALSYLANIPEKCVFLTNLEQFDKMVAGDMEKKDMLPPTDFSNDTSSETATAPVIGVSSIDAPTESMEKDGDIHEQPKPAEIPAVDTASAVDAPVETTEASAESTEVKATEGAGAEAAAAAAATAESEDKVAEVATSPPVAGEGSSSGLIPSRPVTEEDKDMEEDEDEMPSVPADEVKPVEVTTVAASVDEAPVEEKADEAAPAEAESTDDDEKEKDDSEGSEMATDAVIVVDDDKEIESNEVTPVTAATHVNGSPSAMFLSSLLALFAFFLL